jgi:triacylglycerol lipase
MAGMKLGGLGLALASALFCACGTEANDPGFTEIAGGGGSGAADSSSTTSGHGPATSSGSSMQTPLGPPYPIVLAHGFFGFEEFAGIDFVTYFYGVKDDLAAHGETLVFTPAVDPFNSSEYRGAQLADAVEAILADTGYAKVNLIGHSQGGLDARVVAHDHPEWVASVLTVQTPHLGTPLADVALEVVDDPNLQGVLDFLLQAAGQSLWDEIGNQTSLAKPLETFSSQGIEAFNAHYTDRPGIYYASVAGRSDLHPGGADCDPLVSVPFVEQWNGDLDPIDPLFDITEMILDGGIADPYPNDGLLRARDGRWGAFLGCVPADHLDGIGHLLGDSPGFGNSFDHLAFYRDLVEHLREQGL